MLRIGDYTVSAYTSDRFRLDGGAMFGSVPKTLWSKKIPADEQNRIQLCCRLLVLESDSHKILVDLGMGRKWEQKGIDIFAVEYLNQAPLCDIIPDVTDVIITHLHFDHVGGISRVGDGGQLELVYPEANLYVSEKNLQHGQNPGPREKASYLPENITPLLEGKLHRTQDGDEPIPGISLHQANGHTHGLQWLKITDGNTSLVYPSDLMPTAHHVSIPYVMGYDLSAEIAMEEKKTFLQQAQKENWLVVFEHDTDTAAARITKDNKGRYQATAPEKLPEYEG